MKVEWIYGTSLNRTCIHVGNMSIKGIVAPNMKTPMQNLNVLQNTSLNLVMNLADTVARGIYNTINYNE